jgi:3-deoxy-D-manno-octulosonic acid kinase
MVEGFCAVRKGKRIVFLEETLEAQARNRFADAVIKVASAKQLTPSGAWRGRSGKLSVVRTRLEGQWVVVRRFTHGGVLGGMLPEITLGKGRILRELALVNQARRRGVPTPRIIAALLQRTLGLFYRAHVITEEVKGACNMTEFFLRLPSLSAGLAAKHKRAALEEAAHAIASMHAAGILHGDLHLRNVLVRLRDGKEGPRAEGYVVDFDRAGLVENITPRQRLRNLKRLMRSVWKVQPVRDNFSLRDGVRFLRAYLGTRARAEITPWVKELSRPPRRHQAWWTLRTADKREGVPILAAEWMDEAR